VEFSPEENICQAVGLILTQVYIGGGGGGAAATAALLILILLLQIQTMSINVIDTQKAMTRSDENVNQ